MMRWILAILLVASTAPCIASDVVATRTLRVGTILSEGDIQANEVKAEALVKRMLGQEVKRAVYAGWPVEPEFLGPATLVSRNDIVVMHYRSGGLGIRTEGRAMSSGGAGEPVRVMNLTSRLTVHAIVRDSSHVEVVR